MKKALLFLFLIIIGTPAMADYDFEVDGRYYSVISMEAKTCALVDKNNILDLEQGIQHMPGSSYSGSFTIPSTVSARGMVFTVIEIGNAAFALAEVTSVVIPSTVKRIGDYAFYLCQDLRTITIPSNNVEEIGERAFFKDSQLSFFRLSKTTKVIGDEAFYGCSKYVHGISDKLIIPATCEYIGAFAFVGIGYAEGYNNPKHWRIEDGNTPIIYVSSMDSDYNMGASSVYIGRNVRYGKTQYSGGSRCKPDVFFAPSVIFGNKVTEIPDALTKDETVESLSIGKSVKKVGNLRNLSCLKKIKVNTSTPPSATGFSDNAYINCTLFVPKGSLSAYKAAPVWKEFWEISDTLLINEE